MTFNRLLLFSASALLLSTTCKKDYYDGTELVLLKATLNNRNEVIRLTDTLKITLEVPLTITSETNVTTPVNSVQQALYNVDLVQIDTASINAATGMVRVTRIVSPRALVVSEGSMPPHAIGTISVSTTRPPFRSVLNLIPPAKGVYYVRTSKGVLKVNKSYEAFLKVNFDVPDKHWTLANRYIPGYSTAPEILSTDAEGNANYWFRVR